MMLIQKAMELLFDEDDGFDDEVNEACATAAALLAAEEDEEDDRPSWGGSPIGRAPNKSRDFAGAYAKLILHYFSGTDSLYDETDFERRFRMPRTVFNRINDALTGIDPFVQKFNAAMKPGIHPLVRIVACCKLIADGQASDATDDYLQLSETVAADTLRDFTRIVVQEFGGQYLNRPPNDMEKARILRGNERRGFPGSFASWDCKHFVWKNCPIRLAGQHKGHHAGGKKTLILEAIADFDTYLWYTFFGEPGSLNDLNILDKSTIVEAIMTRSFDIKIPPYTINGTERNWLYFLADGIYPSWAMFVKTFHNPVNRKENEFSKMQEYARKDVERAFGIIVQQFGILDRKIRKWYLPDIVALLEFCIIIHNMIVEERRPAEFFPNFPATQADEVAETHFSLFGEAEQPFIQGVTTQAGHTFGAMQQSLMDPVAHDLLRDDLVEHIWNRQGEGQGNMPID
jgi:hypothetical protein